MYVRLEQSLFGCEQNISQNSGDLTERYNTMEEWNSIGKGLVYANRVDIGVNAESIALNDSSTIALNDNCAAIGAMKRSYGVFAQMQECVWFGERSKW